MVEGILKERYVDARRLGIKVIDLDPNALAGYYLHNYPGDPLGALSMDIKSSRVASTVGLPAKIIILASKVERVGSNNVNDGK